MKTKEAELQWKYVQASERSSDWPSLTSDDIMFDKIFAALYHMSSNDPEWPLMTLIDL